MNRKETVFKFIFALSVILNVVLILFSVAFFTKSKNLETNSEKKNVAVEEKIRRLTSNVTDADIAIQNLKEEIEKLSNETNDEPLKVEEIVPKKEGVK